MIVHFDSTKSDRIYSKWLEEKYFQNLVFPHATTLVVPGELSFDFEGTNVNWGIEISFAVL